MPNFSKIFSPNSTNFMFFLSLKRKNQIQTFETTFVSKSIHDFTESQSEVQHCSNY